MDICHGVLKCESRTSGRAEDVIELLDYLGWTKDRELNVVGTSLGGMIATGAFADNVN